jgi:glycosyltransferase involved in cell wall biosynthesis
MLSLPTPRVLVAQIGARRRYAVPIGLAHAGCLHSIVTDACAAVNPWKSLDRFVPKALHPHSLRTLLQRRIAVVPSSQIHGCLTFFLASHVTSLRVRRNEAKVRFWVGRNKAFGRAVSRLDWNNADTVYAFNGAGLEIFHRASRVGVRCVLDQTAAPWSFNTQLLQRERLKWPGWEDHPADIDPDGDMIAREQAEWKLADHIVCGSQFVVDAIGHMGGPVHKCSVVPYPIPECPKVSAPESLPSNRRIRILFVGTLQLRKGIQYVWDAVGRLPSDQFEFRAIGPSALTTKAEQLIRSRIGWYGKVGTKDVWEHYLWADIFLLPTLSEGSANVCWEAIAAGTPIVTTAACGLVGADAVIVDVEPQKIADGLLRATFKPRVAPEASAISRLRSVANYGRELARSIA